VAEPCPSTAIGRPAPEPDIGNLRHHRMKPLVIPWLLLFASALGCSAELRRVDPGTGVICDLADTAMLRDVLYFGRNLPAGGTISDAEWQGFLNEVVTPRFPDGLTVLDATGQWRGKSGRVEQERSEVVMLLHPDDASSSSAVTEIAAEYKRRFGQEAVLRERTPTCARFQ